MPVSGTTITLTTSRGTSTHVISLTHGIAAALFWCTVCGFLIYVVGFSTNAWHESGNSHFGLWKTCSCGDVNIDRDWFRAVQAMACLGLIGFVVAMVLVFLYMFVHSINKNTVIYGFTLAVFLSVICMFIAVIIFGAKTTNYNGHGSYSYAFAIIGTILCVAAGVLAVMQIHKSGSTAPVGSG